MNRIQLSILATTLFSVQIVSAQFKQNPLTYSYDALQGSIDAKTMEIHYSKHGAAYTANLNKAVAGTAEEKQSINAILSNITKLSPAIRNNAGGHYNHELFWSILTPEKDTAPSAKLLQAIHAKFGSIEGLKEQLNKAGADRFGSGWAWLAVSKDGKLFVSSTANQDNPLMDAVTERGTPILGIDVWEHAYYLKYQNKRADYLTGIWSVINWNEVSRRFAEASK